MASKLEDYRLPKHVKPVHYDITIRTDLEKLAFKGRVLISLDVLADTNEIVLNSSGLTFASTALTCNALGNELLTIDVVDDTARERVKFTSTSVLPKGSKALLKVVFDGPLTNSMQGYYKSAWQYEGKTSYYALTQFEPIAARRAFPCWDEPALKATFSIALISRLNTVNISNMPATSEDQLTPNSSHEEVNSFLTTEELTQGQWKITKFQTTPVMSTYLVAYANGEFEYLETTTVLPLKNRVLPLKIYTTKDSLKQAQFALDVKAKVLPLLEQAFGVEFPLPKLDTLIAHDFDAGAMENWGLITGRTTAFLLDPENSDLQARKYVATTQSHEVSHMWFGDITTMEWWTYLYLKEGFATLVGEVIIPDKIFPEWKLDSEFITDHLNTALKLDAKLSSHPIEVDCSDASRIGQIFDDLSYSKAASVLRMLSHYVGEDKFLAGVSLYLKDHLYGNSITKDLWDGIAKETGLDVVALMDDWVSKIGYPVVSVTDTSDGIHVRQDRFLDTGIPGPEHNETVWHIPLSILTVDAAGKPEKQAVVLDTREKTYALDTTKPFKLNAGVYGVYRVHYTPERLAKIAKEASQDNSLFSLNDRVGLVIDATALSQAGLAKLSSTLTLIDTLKSEKEYLVWQAISQTLSGTASIWRENQSVPNNLNAFRRALFVPIVQRLGCDYPTNESLDDKKLRTTAITGAAAAGDQSVIDELKRRFALRSDPSSIPADLQRIIYTTAVKYGGKEEYDAVFAIYTSPQTPTQKTAAINALGATRDPGLLQATFETLLNNSRDQDVTYFFRGFSNNYKVQRTVLNFYEENYDHFDKRFAGNNKMSYLVELVYNSFSTQADYDNTVKFFDGKDTSKYSYALEQSLDNIRTRKAYIERSTDDLVKWLNRWNSEKAAL
ncbi:leucyl aminopeptidase [Pluteus cervinus]|uniref:Leucyl aminopeptidase n=1 Tax=Pluteus cervinus TaxID=181527 RepID=A0ACD3BAS9_9AGAR|nr:leucyl aminopeptidase [Pluteus cervinus]